MVQPRIVFHLPGEWLRDQGPGMLPFYTRLLRGLHDRGIAATAVPMDRAQVAAQIEADDAFHILNHARIPHPRALIAGVAYVYPFWNLDPAGIRAFSSIGDMKFDPATVDGDAARIFFRKLRKRLVDKRASRYAQPAEPASGLPNQAVAVFFQSESHRIVEETLYLDRWTMLEATLAATSGKPVIVKPHPREIDTAVYDRLIALQNRYPQLHISLDNIHDILAASDRVVTINSAVGIEAYLHRKPVILCGKTDFHHIAETARDDVALSRALQHTPFKRPFAKYLYWYFGLNCLNAGAEDLVDQFLLRLSRRGFSP